MKSFQVTFSSFDRTPEPYRIDWIGRQFKLDNLAKPGLIAYMRALADNTSMPVKKIVKLSAQFVWPECDIVVTPIDEEPAAPE
jgi:hypothetical protein